jgi:hypothetical protein
MKPAESAYNRVIIVLRGKGAGSIGRVVGRDPTKHNRILVHFCEKHFPNDFFSIHANNLRQATNAEMILAGNYQQWQV